MIIMGAEVQRRVRPRQCRACGQAIDTFYIDAIREPNPEGKLRTVAEGWTSDELHDLCRLRSLCTTYRAVPCVPPLPSQKANDAARRAAALRSIGLDDLADDLMPRWHGPIGTFDPGEVMIAPKCIEAVGWREILHCLDVHVKVKVNKVSEADVWCPPLSTDRASVSIAMSSGPLVSMHDHLEIATVLDPKATITAVLPAGAGTSALVFRGFAGRPVAAAAR